MTIKELATLTKSLCLEGKGDYLVHFRDSPMSYPITGYEEYKSENPHIKIIHLTWKGIEK